MRHNYDTEIQPYLIPRQKLKTHLVLCINQYCVFLLLTSFNIHGVQTREEVVSVRVFLSVLTLIIRIDGHLEVL